MRILLTVDPEIPVPPTLYGGIERIVDGLVAELRSRHHVVGLLAHSNSTCLTDFFRPWPGRTSNNLHHSVGNTFALARTVQRFKPDVLHSFSRLGYMLPLLLTSLPKIMSYQRHTGGRRNRIAAKLGGRSLVFTACSEYIAAQGRNWGGRWEVVPNFVDTAHYQFVPSVPADAPLVFLSRIERIKGTHTAIEVARRSGRRLVIAGNKVMEGEGLAYWRDEVAPYIDGHKVEYVGPVTDAEKNELLGRAAALLVPVEWDEPFGIVFAEALACGTPIISCPRGALPEIVREGEHGFLVRSVEEGVSAVQRLDMISREACRRRVEKLFSRRVVADRYELMYREMMAQSSQ